MPDNLEEPKFFHRDGTPCSVPVEFFNKDMTQAVVPAYAKSFNKLPAVKVVYSKAALEKLNEEERVKQKKKQEQIEKKRKAWIAANEELWNIIQLENLLLDPANPKFPYQLIKKCVQSVLDAGGLNDHDHMLITNFFTQREKRHELKVKSKFVGEIDQEVILTLTCEKKIYLQPNNNFPLSQTTQNWSYYNRFNQPDKYLHLLRDENNNRIVYVGPDLAFFITKQVIINDREVQTVNVPVKCKCIVRKHVDYKDENQTHIKRPIELQEQNGI